MEGDAVRSCWVPGWPLGVPLGARAGRITSGGGSGSGSGSNAAAVTTNSKSSTMWWTCSIMCQSSADLKAKRIDREEFDARAESALLLTWRDLTHEVCRTCASCARKLALGQFTLEEFNEQVRKAFKVSQLPMPLELLAAAEAGWVVTEPLDEMDVEVWALRSELETLQATQKLKSRQISKRCDNGHMLEMFTPAVARLRRSYLCTVCGRRHGKGVQIVARCKPCKHYSCAACYSQGR